MEQFEEYGYDNHIGARVWYELLIDQIEPLWPSIYPNIDQNEV